NATGMTGDGTALPDAVVDSDNQPTTITVDFGSTGEWGAGVGIDSPLQRMLNGLICTANTPGTPAHITFGNVPAGNHAVIVYLVGIPLQFQDGDYWSGIRSEEHTSELQSRVDIVCRLLLEKKKK